MTENGVSTTQRGQEQYETFFVISTRPKRKAVQYDYRSAETGEFLDKPSGSPSSARHWSNAGRSGTNGSERKD